ncbi:hypothetical protein ACTGWW_11125, partial [Streptococcus suis]
TLNSSEPLRLLLLAPDPKQSVLLAACAGLSPDDPQGHFTRPPGETNLPLDNRTWEENGKQTPISFLLAVADFRPEQALDRAWLNAHAWIIEQNAH